MIKLTEAQKVNNEEMSGCWFQERPTREEAEALHQPGPLEFTPAVIYRTHKGTFALGILNPTGRGWPPHEAARDVKRLLGWEMVAVCDPLLGIWKDYQAPEQGEGE